MNLFTIGFSGKTAQEFFTLLTRHGVQQVIDIRLNNTSQLAGFANFKHLPYLLELHDISYTHMPEFAPTKALLEGYKKKEVSWERYCDVFCRLMHERKPCSNVSAERFGNSVLLCSEPTAGKCHRRLVAEHLQSVYGQFKIKHL